MIKNERLVLPIGLVECPLKEAEVLAIESLVGSGELSYSVLHDLETSIPPHRIWGKGCVHFITNQFIPCKFTDQMLKLDYDVAYYLRDGDSYYYCDPRDPVIVNGAKGITVSDVEVQEHPDITWKTF